MTPPAKIQPAKIPPDADPLSLAFAAARQAAAEGEVPVGAAVVRGGRVLAVAHNRPRALKDPTAHAEILAIRAACAAIGDERLVDCDLYVTLEPCPMCAGAISFARIRRSTSRSPTRRAAASSTGRACSTSRPATMRLRSTAVSARRRRRPAAGFLRHAKGLRA